MSDVTISYNGSSISTMSGTSAKKLLTKGKVCDGNISVAFTAPSSGTGVVQIGYNDQTIATLNSPGTKTLPVNGKVCRDDIIVGYELTKSLSYQSGTAVVEVSDGIDAPLKELTIAIGCVQEGSGDPSPSNPREISARTIANVIVSPTADAADGTTYPITLNSGGTYLAQLNVVTGVLQIYGREMVVNGDPNDRGKRFILKLGDYTNATVYYTQPEDTYNIPVAAVRHLCTANMFKYNYGSNFNALLPWQFGVGNGTQNIFFGFPKTSDYDTREKVNAWATENPIHAVVAYAPSFRPAPIQLTPTEVRSILGTMKLWNEGGTILSVSYLAGGGV